jgi:hypothetical protein
MLLRCPVYLFQRGAVRVEARRTVKGNSKSSGGAAADFWYGPGESVRQRQSLLATTR